MPDTWGIGKVRKRAWWQHTSILVNALKRGRLCPEAWAWLEPERVCPKFRRTDTRASLSASARKTGSVERTPGTPLL
ncbi:hypothetical protein KSC_096340 [Ktedonobacter sp. SOSP1-52]|nr:hypothetical protein KSC_096340 [Ktedonobacter sp. SOSP1-52]